jgi:CTP:molybdopterin cytidylyltransferase MocA
MLVAIVLAAGRGRRLGRPKGGVLLEGRTALQRCVDALRQGGFGEVRAVVDARHHIPPAVGAVMLENPDAERGQTSSLKRALAAGLGDAAGFCVHTVDRPLVRADDVAALVAAFGTRPPGTSIVVPSVGGRRGHPALFATALAAEFTALEDDEPAHRVLRRDPGRVLHLPLDDPWLVRDVDTPDDLEAARATARERDAR